MRHQGGGAVLRQITTSLSSTSFRLRGAGGEVFRQYGAAKRDGVDEASGGVVAAQALAQNLDGVGPDRLINLAVDPFIGNDLNLMIADGGKFHK